MATGLYGRKFVGGISDFLVAGRELGTFLAVATLAATEIGTITFMYYAELGYKTGLRVVRERPDRRAGDDLPRAHGLHRGEACAR